MRSEAKRKRKKQNFDIYLTGDLLMILEIISMNFTGTDFYVGEIC